MKQFDRWALLAFVLICGAVALTACNSGGRAGSGTGIPNLVASAPFLPTDNTMYATAQLNTAGYGHAAVPLGDGTVAIYGGTDERHFTTLDRIEIYDQTINEDPAPESISGVWIDLDFAGDPILLTFGGRCFHTATELPDGNVLIVGGTSDILVGEAIGDAEIYDRQSRAVNPSHLQLDGPMLNPRFNHTATATASGKILIAGGQRDANETIIDPNFAPGHPLFMVDILTFPSTETMEFFNPATMSFEPAVNQNGTELELQTSRGRSEHSTIGIGGFDNTLNTGDDKYLIAGGIRTLSPLFAPQVKFPQRNQVFYVTSLEYFDRLNGVVSTANNVETLRRTNGVRTLNYGQFSKVSPNGDEGTTNIILISHGNDDSHNQIGSPGWTQPQSEAIAVTFTGFGPSEGISFWSATSEFGFALGANPLTVPQLCMGNEYLTTVMNAGGDSLNVMRDPYVGRFVGRVETPLEMVAYSRMINGEEFRGGWGITGGGASTHQENLSVPHIQHFSWAVGNDQLGMEYFDPFYDAPDNHALAHPLGGPLLTDASTLGDEDDNPTNLLGAWLAADMLVAEETGGIGLFESGAVPNTAALRGATCYHTMTRLPGSDGVFNTRDDRILIAGGGQNWLQTGGEPTAVSAHVFLPAGANDP